MWCSIWIRIQLSYSRTQNRFITGTAGGIPRFYAVYEWRVNLMIPTDPSCRSQEMLYKSPAWPLPKHPPALFPHQRSTITGNIHSSKARILPRINQQFNIPSTMKTQFTYFISFLFFALVSSVPSPQEGDRAPLTTADPGSGGNALLDNICGYGWHYCCENGGCCRTGEYCVSAGCCPAGYPCYIDGWCWTGGC